MFGTTYDYNSILHYSDNAFAKKDGMKTLDPKFPAPDMGQRDGDKKTVKILNYYSKFLLNFRNEHWRYSPP